MPYRSSGSPGHSLKKSLSGKPIANYRPKGSPEIRHLIDNGFQAFNAGRLSEACQIFSEKMLAPENDTTIGLTIAGAMTPAGLGGSVIEMMDRGLVDFIISTGANLYHDLHYALNFTLHRGSPFVNDVELYEDGVIRIYDVLFPATVLLETDAYIRDFIVRSGLNTAITTSEFHYRLGLDLLEKNPACVEYSVVARAAAAGVPLYTSSPGDSSIGMNVAYHELMNDGRLKPRRILFSVRATANIALYPSASKLPIPPLACSRKMSPPPRCVPSKKPPSWKPVKSRFKMKLMTPPMASVP